MSEAAEIKRMGARPQPNSGRGKLNKGDAILEPFLIDIKEYKKSFAVSIENWAKLSSDAISAGRRQPAFMIALGEEGTVKARVFVVGERMFHEMREAWIEKYDSEEI
jgi:hypothetical protein